MGMGETKSPIHGAVIEVTRLPGHGSTTVVVTPPSPCGLTGCVVELHVTVKQDTTRVHLNAEQRATLILALRGNW